MSSFSSLVRKLSKVKNFNEGHHLDIAHFSRQPFDNSFQKLVRMFNIRLFFVNNSPYKFYNLKYTNELANLQKELNYLQSRIILRNLILATTGLIIVTNFLIDDFAVDWRDRFDLKFNNRAYGGLDDASGEGNVSIDD